MDSLSITNTLIPLTSIFGYMLFLAFWPLYVVYLLAPMFKYRSIIDGAKAALTPYYRYTLLILLILTSMHLLLIQYADNKFNSGDIENFEFNPNRVVALDNLEDAKQQCRFNNPFGKMIVSRDKTSGKLYGRCGQNPLNAHSYTDVIYDLSKIDSAVIGK